MNHLIRNYLDARKVNADKSKYTLAQIQAIFNMVRNEVCPNQQFGRDECKIWDMFHSMKSTKSEVQEK